MAAAIESDKWVVILTGIGVVAVRELTSYLREGRQHRWDEKQAAALAGTVKDTASTLAGTVKQTASDVALTVKETAGAVESKLNQQTAELVAGSKERNKAIVAAVDKGVADASEAINKSNHLTEKGHAILEQGNAVLEQVVALRKDMEQKVDKP